MIILYFVVSESLTHFCETVRNFVSKMRRFRMWISYVRIYVRIYILISGGSLEFNIHQRWWRKFFWHSLVAWLANIFDVHRLQLRKMIQFDEHVLNLNHLLVVYVGLLYGNFSRRNKGHWWTSMVIDGQNVEERWWIQYKYLWHHYWMSIRNVELVIRFWGCEDD